MLTMQSCCKRKSWRQLELSFHSLLLFVKLLWHDQRFCPNEGDLINSPNPQFHPVHPMFICIALYTTHEASESEQQLCEWWVADDGDVRCLCFSCSGAEVHEDSHGSDRRVRRSRVVRVSGRRRPQASGVLEQKGQESEFTEDRGERHTAARQTDHEWISQSWQAWINEELFSKTR